jgi:hypothetical protein
LFQPQRGIGLLERGVLTALRLCGIEAGSFDTLCHALGKATEIRVPSVQGTKRRKSATTTLPSPSPRGSSRANRDSLFADSELSAARILADVGRTASEKKLLPWYDGYQLPLPAIADDFSLAEPWRHACEQLGVRLVAIRAEVVEPQRFNRLVRHYDNKAQATSRLALDLLRTVWHPASEDETLIVADKHGGRNRYELLLSETFGGAKFDCLEEGAEQSTYRIGNGELRFQPRAEEYGPVALASMTAKYVRELAMTLFNRFWRQHLPDLKPTQGYPGDSQRFREEIAHAQQQLGISDEVLWRER